MQHLCTLWLLPFPLPTRSLNSALCLLPACLLTTATNNKVRQTCVRRRDVTCRTRVSIYLTGARHTTRTGVVHGELDNPPRQRPRCRHGAFSSAHIEKQKNTNKCNIIRRSAGNYNIEFEKHVNVSVAQYNDAYIMKNFGRRNTLDAGSQGRSSKSHLLLFLPGNFHRTLGPALRPLVVFRRTVRSINAKHWILILVMCRSQSRRGSCSEKEKGFEERDSNVGTTDATVCW